MRAKTVKFVPERSDTQLHRLQLLFRLIQFRPNHFLGAFGLDQGMENAVGNLPTACLGGTLIQVQGYLGVGMAAEQLGLLGRRAVLRGGCDRGGPQRVEMQVGTACGPFRVIELFPQGIGAT